MARQYNLNDIYVLTETQLDNYISQYTKEPHASIPDKRYTAMNLLNKAGMLDSETSTMVKNPEFFEALKVGEFNPQEVRTYLNPQVNYAQQHENIVAVLQRLAHIYNLLGSTCIGNAPKSGTCSTQNNFKSKAFNNAANQMNEYYGPLDAASVRKIPEIGPSSLEVIEDVVTTGRSKRLDLLEQGKDENGVQVFDSEMLKTLDSFRKVFGIGPKKSLDFYRQGYRSVKDLSISDKLTDAEKLGLQYYEPMQQRIPRSEMDAWVQFFTKFFNNEPENPSGGYIWSITGSYRRGEPTSGDIDLITMNAKPQEIVKLLGQYIIGTFSSGPEKVLALIQAQNTLPRRLDVRIFPKDEWYYGLLYNTGSQNFTIMMRTRAKQLGYRLDEYKLIDANGNHLPANSEQDIFNYLKVKYLAPNERTSMLAGLTPA